LENTREKDVTMVADGDEDVALDEADDEFAGGGGGLALAGWLADFGVCWFAGFCWFAGGMRRWPRMRLMTSLQVGVAG
jgi:hypothetical protein